MTPDVGILTTLLNTFSDSFTNGLGLINGDARWLLAALMAIDLILAILLNLSDGDHMKTLITKILKYGFFIWIVIDYRQLVNVVLESFEMIGLKAGGGGLTTAMLSDPSNIASYGIWVTEPIFRFIDNLGLIDALQNLPKIMFTGFTGIAILLCYFIIGIQIFITYLEFYVIATLALILLPFGVNKHTAFLGEKAIGAVLSFGIKLMVLSFIASVAIPLVKSWSVPVDPTYEQIFCLFLGSLAIAFLAWHAPGVAAGLLSGHPTLTTGSAAGFGIAGALAATGAGYAGATIAKKSYEITKAAASGVGNITGGGISSGRSLLSNKMSTGNEGENGGGSSSGESTQQPQMRAGDMAYRLQTVKNAVPPESHGGGGSATPNLKS